MKLIKQIQLFIQEGSSDKVYEIDLCETPSGEYLVNFRYGRRGAALKEGTKTVFPVSLPEAERTFAALEQEKRKKGYAPSGEVAIQEDFVREAPKKGEKRRKAIMRALRQAVEGEEHETWPLSRIIWRAGELKFIEAEPLILKLIDASDTFIVYASIWALARTGSIKSVPALEKLKADASLPAYVSNLAVDALLTIGGPEIKQKLLLQELESLPNQLKTSLEEKQYGVLRATAKEYLLQLKTSSNKYLVALYRLSYEDPELKSILLEVLHELQPKPGTFKYLRQIFKTAAMRDDFDTYGAVARIVEKNPAGYINNYGWAYGSEGYVEPAKEFKKENPSIAFSGKTKAYLTLKTLRDLRRRAEDDNSYTALATGILLAFDDKDARQPSTDGRYEYVVNARGRSSYEYRTIHFDRYAVYVGFNHILYQNSSRYQISKTGRTQCIGDYEPGKPVPKGREEAFPALWNEDPENIIKLLTLSKVDAVHEFAFKVFKANANFANLVTLEQVISFLKSPFEATAQLGFELAIQKYDATHPQKNLVVALLESTHAEAVATAHKWLSERKELYLTDDAFVTTLILSARETTRLWAREWLSIHGLSEEVAQKVLSTSLSTLLTDESLNSNESYISSVVDTLILVLPEWVKRIALDTILLLIKHPNLNLQLTGAKLLLKNHVPVENLPETILLSLVSSEKESVRAVGLEIMARLPEALLSQKKNLLVSLLISPMADVRNNVKPVLTKLVQHEPAFAAELAELLVPALLMPETYEGIHEDLVGFLTNELVLPHLNHLDKAQILGLSRSRNRPAQSLGIKLLKQNVSRKDLSVEDIVKLSDNAQLEARQYAWGLYETENDRIKAEKEEAIKITDAYWEDSRKFGFAYFREKFVPTDWTPQLFVGLCDSVKPDVQAFGREMITRCFESEQGEYYLLSLSQHPDSQMQLFASNHLESFASGKPEVVQKLELFFVTLLSQVNKGRTAKARLLAFLKKESLNHAEVAQTTARILNRVSATVSIQDKAKYISMLLEIKKKFAEVDILVKINPIPDYVNQD